MNITGGILARVTNRAKILMLGNMLPTSDNPVRLAEEIAMLDVISGGRIISGFVRGHRHRELGQQHQPGLQPGAVRGVPRPDYEDLDHPRTLPLEGKHYHYRAVNPWMLPIQQPHPPVWVPGTGSPETVKWAAENRYTYAAFLTKMDVARNLFGNYRKFAAEDGWEPGPEKFAFMICAHVNDTDEKAQESGKAFLWRMGHPLKGPKEYWAPPGYFSAAGAAANALRRPKPLNELTYQELQDEHHLVVGSPDTVIKKLRYIKEELGIGALLLEAQAARCPTRTPCARWNCSARK